MFRFFVLYDKQPSSAFPVLTWKRYFMKKILPFCMVVLIVAACSKSNSPGGGTTNGGGNTGGTNPGTPGPLFTAVKSVLGTNCAVSGCHAGSTPQNGLNFTDNNTIVAQKDRIKARAVDAAGTANQMPPPPNAPLPDADRKKITDWVAAGGRLTD